MGVIDRAIDAIANHEATHGVTPKVMTLAPRLWTELVSEAHRGSRHLTYAYCGATEDYFMGVKIRKATPTGFCRNCGAPAEPHACSYCRTPSDFITLE